MEDLDEARDDGNVEKDSSVNLWKHCSHHDINGCTVHGTLNLTIDRIIIASLMRKRRNESIPRRINAHQNDRDATQDKV